MNRNFYNKNIKHWLNEDIQNFDVTEYNNDSDDIINHSDINNIIYKYHPQNNKELRHIISIKIKPRMIYAP